MLKIATGKIHEDGTETRTGVASFLNLKAFCDALNKGSAPSTGKQKWGPYWSPFDAPRRKGEKPDWQLLVLDFDNGNPTRFEGLEHIRYQTPSSTPEKPRWRLIIAVDEAIEFASVDKLRRCWPESDPAAVKPTQIFWHRHPLHLAEYHPGASLNWRAIVADLPPDPVPVQPVVTEPTMGRAALTEALYKLDPDSSYDDWLRIGMALHHEYNGSQDGFNEWLHWSERGVKFAGVNDLHSHWRSFKPGGGVTGLSLLAMQSAKVDDFPIITNEQPKRVRVIPAREFVYRSRPPWLIKGLFGGELGVIYGESTAGKTFLAVDLAMCVARGIPWNEHRVKGPGRVVWIAAEDAYGVQQRQLAYCKHFGCDPGINAIDARVLLTKADDVRDLIEAIGSASLIVVDTLARVNGGDENDAGEMSVLVRNCQALNKATGAFVLLIHHSGWDKTHLRGSSALRAAVDAELRVSVLESGERQAQATKVKGGPSGKVYGFKLERVELGVDTDGDMETSCIVLPVAASAPSQSTGRLGGNQKIAWNVLQTCSGDLTENVLDAICAAGDMRRDNARRALRELIGKGIARFDKDRAFLSTDIKADFETLLGVSNGTSN